MPSKSTCPICGKPLASDAPQGLCPACLLQAGVPTGASAPAAARRSFVPPTPAELAALFPQLEILKLIGQGGMGAVYRARQPVLDRLVALKILSPDPSRDPAFAERFTREARALAKLSHPNIVAVHDYGQAGGFHYLVMEFVDGVNLRQLLNTARMTPKEALAIVPPICEALQFAHDRGVVHRDIKPENILIDKNGAVKIADFGLAKLVGGDAPDFSITGAGDVMGTPHYMAPEQVEHPLEVDHRADIYSVGVVFYQMLTGELPLGRFAAPSRKVQIDVRLDEVVLRALEKEPEQRYQQASGLRTAVETIATTRAAQSAEAAAPRVAPGMDYRSKATLWGLPLVHVATGIDPATGKTRIARGIVAIGKTAFGVVAFGGFACGGITVGGLSVGVLAFGGTAVGAIALGGLAVAGLFAAGGLALGTVAVGGIGIGYLAYGNGAIAVHGIGRNVSDPFAREFFTKWAETLVRASTISALVVGMIAPFVALWVAWRAFRASRAVGPGARRRWVVPMQWIVAALLILMADGVLMNVRSLWRYYGRNNIGFVSQLSPLAISQEDSREMVVMEGWLVEGAMTMNLAGTGFDPRRPGNRGNISVRRIVPPVSIPLGGSFSTVATIPTGGQRVRFRVTATTKRDSYLYTITATLDSGSRVTQDNGRAKVQPNEKVEISASDGTAANVPVLVELGSFAPDRKHVAVFIFHPLDGVDLGAVAPASTSANADQSPTAGAPTTQSRLPMAGGNVQTDFDRTESDPEILKVLLQQAEAELSQIKARYAAGIASSDDLQAAQLKHAQLEARSKGDRVAFAAAKLVYATKHLELISSRRQAGLADEGMFTAAQADKRIAEIQLRREEEAQRSGQAVEDAGTGRPASGSAEKQP